jgi:2-polyprenyl-3-methyl-5-hydroxy-6-metoxy-1,4-benzoquinol methylase
MIEVVTPGGVVFFQRLNLLLKNLLGMSVDTAQIKKNQIELLLDSQKLLGKCSIAEFLKPLHFSFNELNPNNSLELQNKIKLHCAGIKENLIYTISLKNPLPVQDLQSAILNYKRKKYMLYPR